MWETPPGFALETDLPILRGMPASAASRQIHRSGSPSYQEAKSAQNLKTHFKESLQNSLERISAIKKSSSGNDSDIF